jgi:hypothetical protein
MIRLATLLALPAFPASLAAQAGLGQLEDATTPPKGFLRFRPIIVWTRYDSRFTASGTEPLGAGFTADSLGSARYAPLGSIETLTRNVAQAGSAYRLSVGRSRLDATARDEVLPLVFDYGVTNRFSVGFVVPIVRRRLSTLFQLDSTGANVGPNLNRTNPSAVQTNTLVQSQFATAASQLQTRISSCQGDPSGLGCAAVLAQGPALLSEAQTFATQVSQLYGTDTAAGAAFVPRNQSPEQTAVAARVVDFNSRYFALLGTNFILAVPVGAAGPSGVAEFQSFVVENANGDSLSSQELFGVGDLEVGFKLRVIDRPISATQRLGLQFAVGGSVRLPTGSREPGSAVVDMRFGEGDPVVDVRAILDTRIGRFGFLGVGHQSFRMGDKAPPITVGGQIEPNATTWLEIDVAPRWYLSEVYSLHGAYSYRTSDVWSDQLVGGGVTFSAFASRRPGSTPPVEARFTHLEAITGDPGRPKFFREQVEVRIYFRLF